MKIKKTTIHLTFQVDENEDYIISDNLSLMYGVGETPAAALRDYAESLADYMNLLERDANNKRISDQNFGRIYTVFPKINKASREQELRNAGGESPQQPERGRIVEFNAEHGVYVVPCNGDNRI